MRKLKRAIIDLSSVLWTCLLAGKDKEFGRVVVNDAGKEVTVNSGSYGYENAINHLLEVMKDLSIKPYQMIFVPEGKNAKAERQFLYPDYKAGRDKVPEAYEQFNIAKEMLLNTFCNLGAQACWQDGGVEGDDVMGYLAYNLEGERWIVSGDKDLATVVGGDIHHWRSGSIDRNPFGEFRHDLIPTFIALVGDASDGIKGAKGFGAVAGAKLVSAFGDEGLEMMRKLILDKGLLRLQEDIAELPELQKVIDSAESVYLGYELARLRVEKVNTLRRPLAWRVGMVKPRTMVEDDRLRVHGGVVKLISAAEYDTALPWVKDQISKSPYVALDVETATPEESDEWLKVQDKEDKVVDVFGSKLTSLQLTFGPNLQYTVYLPIDNIEEHDVKNLTVAQVAALVDLIPRGMVTYVHNAGFELPICYMAWGDLWKDDPEYHGFLRNVRDTMIGSSYVDENVSKGLKSRSKDLLGYDQVTYDDVTTKEYEHAAWSGLGTVLASWWTNAEGETVVPEVSIDEESGTVTKLTEGLTNHVRVQHKMNQMTARQCLLYGADDSICTAALANHFQVVMEIEKTILAYEEVETYPAYLTALAFVQGKPFSLQLMREMEKDDDTAYDVAAPILREYLMAVGFEGTRFEPITELTPAEVKRAHLMVTGQPLETKVRTMSKMAKLMEDDYPLLAHLVANEDIRALNEMMRLEFKGDPKLELASPKQMKTLLYDFMDMPIRVINDMTPLERVHNKPLDEAVKKFKQHRAGKGGIVITAEDRALLRQKAKTDDTAIDMALAFDAEMLGEDARKALRAIGTMKKVMTRRSLFYKNWRHAPHWKDNKIHASFIQCEAVTRRYSSRFPNEQQLPKKGEAVRFRACYKPHKKNAVVASIDYVGQELRLAAEVSQDKNMLACYVGDNLKDIHSITAAGAMQLKWGRQEVDYLFAAHGPDLSRNVDGTYELFLRLRGIGKAAPIGKKADDLRKDSKNVNFGAQNGAMAPKLAETLIMLMSDAQLFLDARSAMFPDVAVAAQRAADEAKAKGYVTTLMGARRHLREAILSSERGAAERAARQSWNFRIQGSAGEMSKMGMTRMWKTGIYFRYDARFMAPIHDELVSSVAEEDAVNFLREKHACMAQPYATMKVPVLGSISIGPDFANQTECGDWFIAERIEQALNDIFAKEEHVNV